MTPTYAPGDLVFTHSKGIIGKAIRLGEWLRFRRGSQYNHVAILDREVPNQLDWYVIQAEGRGVTSDGKLSTIEPGGFYTVVPLPDGVDADKVLAFARAQVGRRYGFVTIASIITTIILPSFINVMLPNTWICSAVSAEAVRFGGWYHPWSDIYQVMPSQLWEAIDPTSFVAATQLER